LYLSIHSAHSACIVNGGAYGRRLASPVRLSLADKLGGDLDGAWWPRTTSLASELPEFVGALLRPLGDVIDISVNWSSLAGSPKLDPLRCPGGKPMPGETISDQRLMMITAKRGRASVLVVPCRTSTALAVTVLRLAAALPFSSSDAETVTFRTAAGIVHSARMASRLHRVRAARTTTPMQ
jgi:hypothetical protein